MSRAVAADDTDDRAVSEPPDGLMVFDGVCVFCSGTVATVLKLDRIGAIRFTAIQTPYGRALATAHGIDAVDPESFLFFDRGRPLTKSDAILAVAARLSWPLRWVRVFGLVPRTWRDRLYNLVARNRYRLFGRRQTCFVPTPEMRARFIQGGQGEPDRPGRPDGSEAS